MKWPLYVFLFGAGVVCGVGILLIDQFKWSFEVSVVQLLNLFVALTLAFLFQYYIKQKIDVRKAERDILTAQTKTVIENLNAARKTFVICYQAHKISGQEASTLKMELRSLSNAVALLETLTTKARFKPFASVPLIKQDYLVYKKILTGDRFPSAPYELDHYLYADRCYQRLTENLLCLNLHIQHAD